VSEGAVLVRAGDVDSPETVGKGEKLRVDRRKFGTP